MSEAKPLPTKPIGVIASLAAGFDTVIQGWWVLFFPVIVDLFLWLGPHLSITPVATRALDNLVPLVGENLAIEPLLQAVEELNYFSVFSVTPLGVPSLMSLKLPQLTPVGSPVVLSIGSELLWLTVFLGLSLCGLMVGGLYLGLIAQQVRDGRADLPRLLGVLPRYWISIVALIIILLLAVTTRHDDDVFAFSMGAFCVFVVFVTNTYYWQMLCFPAIAFAQRYRNDMRSFLYLLYLSVFLAGSYLFIHVGADAARHLQGYFGSIRLFVLCLLMVAVEAAWALKAKKGQGINPA